MKAQNFIVPLNGLASGKAEFCWNVGSEFFQDFGNTDILDARLEVKAVAEKAGKYVGVDCCIDGRLVVECDRCLEDLELPVHSEIRLSIKYGPERTSSDGDKGDADREIIYMPDNEADLDMSQLIYDYVCLSLPMQKVHMDGRCNPDTVKFLSSAERADEGGEKETSGPFAVLKGLFDN